MTKQNSTEALAPWEETTDASAAVATQPEGSVGLSEFDDFSEPDPYDAAIYKALGIYLPLITTNCAVLGVALTNVQDGYNFIQSVLSGFGTAVGYTVAIVLLASIRSRIHPEDIPEPLRGAPIVLISAALMSIAFMGFSSLSF